MINIDCLFIYLFVLFMKISDVYWQGGANYEWVFMGSSQQVPFKQRLEGKGNPVTSCFWKTKIGQRGWNVVDRETVRWGENWAGAGSCLHGHDTAWGPEDGVRGHLKAMLCSRLCLWRNHVTSYLRNTTVRRSYNYQSLKNCELWIHINPPSICSYL